MSGSRNRPQKGQHVVAKPLARQQQSNQGGGQHSSRAPKGRQVASQTRASSQRPSASELYPERLKSRERSRSIKHVALGVLAVLLVAACALGGYALWFSLALNDALSMGADQDTSVDAALVAAEAGEPFYALVLGSDSREGSGTSAKTEESGENQRSDVIMLLRVDAANKQVTMVTVPRDTPYTLENGSTVKINELYNLGGAPASIRAVSEVTGVPISHYAEIHFSELQGLVDELGGVTVDVDVALSYVDALTGETVSIEPGTQTLDGQQAQIFARARHEYQTDQDAYRQNNVRALATAIIDKALDRPLYELPSTVLTLAGYVGTDINTIDIVSLALGFAGKSGSMTVYSCTGPNTGAINEDAGGLWLCYENPEGWANLMDVVDAGDDPSGIDVNVTAIIPGEEQQDVAA